jgi:hypothetical protein
MKRTPLKRKTPLHRGTFTLKRTRVNPVSTKQRKRASLYTTQRKAYLAEHSICEVCGRRDATDIHHKAGRGGRTNDESTFTAVCRECHDWIHHHPADARAKGFLV